MTKVKFIKKNYQCCFTPQTILTSTQLKIKHGVSIFLEKKKCFVLSWPKALSEDSRQETTTNQPTVRRSVRDGVGRQQQNLVTLRQNQTRESHYELKISQAKPSFGCCMFFF